MIEREVMNKKSGVTTVEHALGITSQTPKQAEPKQVLAASLQQNMLLCDGPSGRRWGGVVKLQI